MTWLAYRYLAEHYGSATDEFLSPELSKKLLATISAWAEPLFEVTHDSLVDAFNYARENDGTTGLQEFFRERKHQDLCKKRFQTAVERTARGAVRTKQGMPEYLHLPT